MAKTVETLITELDARISGFEQKMTQATKTQERFNRGTRDTAAQADPLGQRYAQASLRIASAAESMARSGNIAGSGLKQIIAQGSNLAFMFGPQGAVVGAIGVTAVAIVELIKRANSETAALLKELESQAKGSADRIRLELVRTTTAALAAQKTRLEAQPATIDRDQFDPLTGVKTGTVSTANPAIARAKELTKQLALLAEEEKRILGVLGEQRETAFTEEVQRLIAIRNEDALTTAQRARLAIAEHRVRVNLSRLREQLDKGTESERAAAEKSYQRQLVLLRQLEGEKAKASSKRVSVQAGDDALAAANRALDEFAQRTKETQKEVRRLLESASDDLAELAGDSVAVLDAQIDRTIARLRELKQTEDVIARVIAPLVAARNAAAALGGAARRIEIPAGVQKALKGISDETENATDEAESLAERFSNVVDVALGISTALSGADSHMTRLIAGAAQLVSSFAKVADLAEKAGGLRALLSTGGGLASLLPALGGIIGGIGAIATLLPGKKAEDPAVKAQREALIANTKRLEDLRDGLVKLTLSLSGGENAAIRDVKLTGFRPKVTEFGTFDVEQELAIDEVLKALRLAGVSLDDLRRAASDFGVVMSESPTIAELKALQEAIRTFSLDKLFEGIEGALSLNELRRRLNPGQSPLKSLLDDLAVLGGPKGAGVFKEVRDLVEAGDFAGAQQRLREFLDAVAAGTVDLKALGDIDPEELPGLIVKMFESIEGLAPAAKSAADVLEAAITDLEIELETLDITDSTERAKRIIATVAGLVPAIANAIGDIDITSLAGAQAADAKVRELFAQRNTLSLVERGGLSVDEFTQALLRLDATLDATTGALKDQIEEQLRIAQQAEADRLKALSDAERTAEEERARRVRAAIERARNESIFAGEGAAASVRRLVAELAKLSPAFDGLLDGLDLDSAAGLFELNQRLQELFTTIGPDGANAADLGTLSYAELLAALLDVRGASDTLAGALDKVATDAQLAADRLRDAFGELDFTIELRGITDPIARLRESARQLGNVLPQIAGIVNQFAIDTVEGRAGAEAALVALGQRTSDGSIREAVLRLLGDIRAVPLATQDAGIQPGVAGAGAATTIAGTPQITSIQADRLLDIQRSQLTIQRQILDRITALLPIVPPNIPATLGGGITLRVTNTVNFGALPAEERSTATRITEALLHEIDEGLSRLRDRELLALGVTAR